MLITILAGIFMLGVCIIVHELGHLLMGRAVGVKAEIFSVGYGRGIWKKKIGDTTWQITAIPLGGYVKFYGDDYEEGRDVPGGFFSVSPLKRIIPVLGGPLFNLILGIVIFLGLGIFTAPPSNEVVILEELGKDSPAYQGGLRTGDRVVAIAGAPVENFYDIQNQVILSGGKPLEFQVMRDQERKSFSVTPAVDSAGRASIGIRVPGDRLLRVDYPFGAVMSYRFKEIFGDAAPPAHLKALPYLHEGDVILSVEGETPASVLDLQRLLGRHGNGTVTVKVQRETASWIAPWFTKETEVEVPVQEEYRVWFTNIRDLKYNASVPDQQLASNVPEHLRVLADLRVGDRPAGSYVGLSERFPEKQRTTVSIGDQQYEADVLGEKFGLMGFRPAQQIDSLTGERPELGEGFVRGLERTYQAIMLYPQFFGQIFAGRVSFIENAAGPVRMFAYAGVIARSSLTEYFHLMAAISIALMVINLLPFPVVDGGHIVFFLLEAIAGKPLSRNVMEGMYRFGFIVLV
ncbi:MAG: site-2 protease family protein, partial [Leptospiraceae bacterium]|nr:site-2 protease family protein [Leptospiraceae bacterium]